jgi:hypothetical protein
MSSIQEKKASICFLTVILLSVLTAIYIQIESYTFDFYLFLTTLSFVIYLLFFLIQNSTFRKVIIILEGIYVLFYFYIGLALSKYDLGEYLFEFFLLLSHTFIRILSFLIVAQSKKPLIIALIISFLIATSIYFYGSTDYLRIM